jgi:hypothetical protein
MNKSDYIDAEAIAEAVGRPKMRFVPVSPYSAGNASRRSPIVGSRTSFWGSNPGFEEGGPSSFYSFYSLEFDHRRPTAKLPMPFSAAGMGVWGKGPASCMSFVT